MKKAILFDLDGTLLNTDLLIKKSFIHTLKNTNQTILYLKKNFYLF